MSIKINVYTHKPELYYTKEDSNYYENGIGCFVGLYGNPEEGKVVYCKTEMDIPKRIEKLKKKQIAEYEHKIKEIQGKIKRWENFSV